MMFPTIFRIDDRQPNHSEGLLTVISQNILMFVHRCKMSYLAFKYLEDFGTILKLKNGIELDLDQRKIVLTENTHIHCNGDFIISSDKHIIIESGKGTESSREGVRHAVWVNPEKDDQGRPIILIDVIDENGKRKTIEGVVFRGQILLPEGYTLADGVQPNQIFEIQ